MAESIKDQVTDRTTELGGDLVSIQMFAMIDVLEGLESVDGKASANENEITILKNENPSPIIGIG